MDRSCLLSVASQFETPLGNVRVDRDCIAELEKTVSIYLYYDV